MIRVITVKDTTITIHLSSAVLFVETGWLSVVKKSVTMEITITMMGAHLCVSFKIVMLVSMAVVQVSVLTMEALVLKSKKESKIL